MDAIVHLKVCSGVLLLPYNKGFLDLQLKFVFQANSGIPKLLIATIYSPLF